MSKIAAIRRDNAECIALMRTFCLSPSESVYTRLTESSAVTNCEFYKTWCAMAKLDPADKMKRELIFAAMLKKVSEEPTKNSVMQLLYVFAATGWFVAIEKFYECMGDSRLVTSVRAELAQEYREWKELYTDRIRELVNVNPEHFTSRGIDRTAVDFTRFDVYQREYERRKAAEQKK